MATTTADVPIYFPGKRKDKKRRKGRKMNEVEQALDLVESMGFSPSDALEVILEQEKDYDKAAKKMAKKAANGDADKEKELEAKFKKAMERKGKRK